jgi:hypothetical protein
VASVPAAQGDSLFVENQHSGGGAISAAAHGDVHAVEGIAYPDESGPGFGVRGISSLPDGFGDGPGVGVHGQSGTGVGVLGTTATGIEVEARSDQGIALVVNGMAVFSTAGGSTIPLGQSSMFVSDSAVTDESHITATLTGSPGSFVSGFPPVIQWLERQPGQGFVIHLTRKVGQATPFTYLIVEPG